MLNALAALQLALNNYSIADANTVAALLNAGNALVTAADNAKNNQPTQPPLPNSVTNQADQTGDKAKNLANGTGGVTQINVQNEIDQAHADLADYVNLWPASCALLATPASYWDDWKRLVFFQVAAGYQPGGSGICTAATCLQINGIGAYHAAVLVAGRPVGTLARDTTNPATYLEGINPHSGATPDIYFETYNMADAQYQSKNDLVLCVNPSASCP